MCVSWILKSGLRLRGAVAAVGVIVATGGALLAGDIGRPWQGTYYPGLGYAFVDVGLGAILVFILLDALLTRQKIVEEEAQMAIWNPVRDRVNGLVKSLLSETLVEIILVTDASKVVAVPFAASPEEIWNLQKQQTLKELKRLATDKSALASSLAAGAVSLLDGQYKKLFLERGRSLGNLQNRYWSRFLDAQRVALLIDLEQLLYRLDTKIVIVRREREAARNGTLQPISQTIAKVNIDQLYEILQRIIALLVDGVDKKLVEFG